MHDDDESKPDNVKPTIIVQRKIKKYVHKHHGGGWKIAYADFVTAMMTFFLLMWLLSMLNKSQLSGISAYFKKPYQSGVTSDEDLKRDKIFSDTNVRSEDTEKRAGPAPDQDTPLNADQSFQESAQASTDQSTGTDKASEAMKQDLEKQLNSNPLLSQYKNALNIKVTAQGLKIELKDLDKKPMFSNGKTDFSSYAKEILEWLASTLNKYPNRVMIVGHTDNKPILKLDYSNWELSSDRSNATRRTLVGAGMDINKVVRVVGVADTDNLEGAAEDDPSNRRISIIILTDDAYKKMKDQ